MTVKKLLLVVLASMFTAALYSETLDFYSDAPDEKIIKSISDNMSSSQLAGQVLMFGYWGEEPSEEILKWISEKNIGGIKFSDGTPVTSIHCRSR